MTETFQSSREEISRAVLIQKIETKLSEALGGRNVASLLLYVTIRAIPGHPNWRISAGDGVPPAVIGPLLNVVGRLQQKFNLSPSEHAELLKAQGT